MAHPPTHPHLWHCNVCGALTQKKRHRRNGNLPCPGTWTLVPYVKEGAEPSQKAQKLLGAADVPVAHSNRS